MAKVVGISILGGETAAFVSHRTPEQQRLQTEEGIYLKSPETRRAIGEMLFSYILYMDIIYHFAHGCHL